MKAKTEKFSDCTFAVRFVTKIIIRATRQKDVWHMLERRFPHCCFGSSLFGACTRLLMENRKTLSRFLSHHFLFSLSFYNYFHKKVAFLQTSVSKLSKGQKFSLKNTIFQLNTHQSCLNPVSLKCSLLLQFVAIRLR